MNKQFDVIPVEDYGVLVDKEHIINAIYYCPYKGQNIDVGHGVAPQKHIFSKNVAGNLCPDCVRVLATINKRIDDIPLIEIPDEIEKLAEKHPDTIMFKDIPDLRMQAYLSFKEGYKAANKGYSKEDIEEAIDSALKACNLPIEASKSFPADILISRNYLKMSLEKSLQPKLPKSVVLEMEDVSKVLDIRWDNDKPYNKSAEFTPKITNPETNSIIPIKVNL